MVNSIHQGPEKIQRPDQDGVIVRGPSPALDDLRAEVDGAVAARAAGNQAAAREISTIQSRADLREAARLELPPTSTVDGPVYTKVEPGRELAANWADLDAAEFARMRSEKRKEVALESIAANVRSSPEYGEALAARSPIVAEAAARMNERLVSVEAARQPALSQANADALRAVGHSSDTLLAMPRDSLEPERARSAALEDLAALQGINDDAVRSVAARAMGQVAANQPAYRAELERQAPAVAVEVASAYRQELVIDPQIQAQLAERRAQDTRDVSAALAADRDAAEVAARAAQVRADAFVLAASSVSAQAQAREAALDASAQSQVARRRADDSRAAAEALGLARDPARDERSPQLVAAAPAVPSRTEPQLVDAGQSRGAPGSDQVRGATEQAAKEADAEQRRVLKRPILEEELSDALRSRFVVSTEKKGLLDKGRTEFSFRGGERDGQVAFHDAGKQLATVTEDRAVIRAMVDVATAKGWKEITVNGTDEFRRSAWLEAQLQGLDVHGYQPREADKKRLMELQAERATVNTITTNDREPTRAAAPAQGDAALLKGIEKASQNWQFIAPSHQMTRGEAAEWVRDDVAALRAIKGDNERRAAIEMMAFNAQGQKSYRAELAERAPQEAKVIGAMADRPLPSGARDEPLRWQGAEPVPRERDTSQEVEWLRARLIMDLRNRPGFDPEEQAKMGAARKDGDRRSDAEVILDAQRRRQNDVVAVMRMNPSQLVELAKVIDTPATASSNRQLRQMIDGPSRHEPASAVEPKERQQADRPAPRGREIDGDALSPKERTTIEAMRDLLKTKGFGPEFVAATVTQLERDMRGQRVHIGELVAHGAAPYKHDKEKGANYFVTLKTPDGLETIWGKRLGEALSAGNVQKGDQVVLVNTGKKSVEVDERAKDESGKTVVRRKDALLNEWTAQPIDRIAATERASLNERQRRGEPALQVYDPRASRQRPEAGVQQDGRDQTNERQAARQDPNQGRLER